MFRDFFMIELNVNPDISKARSIDSEFYINSKYYNVSVDKIFKKSWQLTCHKSELVKTNLYPFTFLDNSVSEPLIISKVHSQITCLSNVCTHRGHILQENKCNRKKIRCDYHGRTFNLDGSFDRMPGFEGVDDFPAESDNLKKIPLLDWNGFIFTGINPEIRIDTILNDINSRLKNFPFDNIYFSKDKSRTYTIDANWALYCENYLEGLHVPYVHKGLNSEIDIKSYKTEIIDNGVLQYTDSKNSNAYAHYYWIFPNMMLNFYDWGLSINIVEPIAFNKTRIKFLTFPIKNALNVGEKINELHEVELEDEKVVLNVQRGVQSKFYKNGRYSKDHEKGTHHFHRLICQYIK